jgi:hypothetical protein
MPLLADDRKAMPPRYLSVLMFSLLACRGPAEPSACQGFAERELAITGAEYRPCAGQILAALDSLQPHLQAILSDSSLAVENEAARRALDRLQALVRQTGIEDDYRSMRPGTVIVKWPDHAVSAFNSAAFTGMVQYMAVLAHPNEDNFAQGKKAHEEARSSYRQIE